MLLSCCIVDRSNVDHSIQMIFHFGVLVALQKLPVNKLGFELYSNLFATATQLVDLNSHFSFYSLCHVKFWLSR